MDMEKKKLDDLTKIKIMLTVEYGVFVAIFAVLGALFLADIIKVAEWKRYAFTYVTLAGAVWIITDFIWTTFSKKRREKNCYLDKILVLPVGLVLICFDIYAITQGCAETLPYRYFIGGNLSFLALVYAFEAIYHWFKPIPAVIEAALEAKRERDEAELGVSPEEPAKEEPKEEKAEENEEK